MTFIFCQVAVVILHATAAGSEGNIKIFCQSILQNLPRGIASFGQTRGSHQKPHTFHLQWWCSGKLESED